ncbi:hypothetical protein ACPCHT_08670 [Nucisporomicrobium flavum]|nr:hypothetical protein [Nucisporomicrobium flavum]
MQGGGQWRCRERNAGVFGLDYPAIVITDQNHAVPTQFVAD